jgi:hypothetical protein
MDVTKATSSVASTGNNQQDVSYAIQRKTQDIQQQTAAQLIDSVKSPATVPNLPSNLGNTINTKA